VLEIEYNDYFADLAFVVQFENNIFIVLFISVELAFLESYDTF